MQKIKQQLIDSINKELELKITALQDTISATKESRDSDTKSSVGDKYETSRAMAQMELDKSQHQLSQLQQQQYELSKIKLDGVTEKVAFGSLVKMNDANYLLSVGFGKIVMENDIYYAISTASPIGQLLLNKLIGDVIQFRNINYKIEAIR